MFEDTKRVIRSRKSKDRQYNNQMNKRTNNDRQTITLKIEQLESSKNLGWTQVLRTGGKESRFCCTCHTPSWYSCYKPCDKS